MTRKTPNYYIGKHKGITAMEVVDDFNLTHRKACATEYILRSGKKSKETEIEDLQKAIHHLEMEVEFITKQK